MEFKQKNLPGHGCRKSRDTIKISKVMVIM